MESFEVVSVQGDGKLLFHGAIPKGASGHDGCHFTASLISTPLSASVRVYDLEPAYWSGYFATLARNWRGWEGSKERESLEGHLRIVATTDSLGHISLRVYLRDVDSDWRAEDVIVVEAGQLDSIAANAKNYFR